MGNMLFWRKKNDKNYKPKNDEEIVSRCSYEWETPNTSYYLPTPPLGQAMTQGQFLSGV